MRMGMLLHLSPPFTAGSHVHAAYDLPLESPPTWPRQACASWLCTTNRSPATTRIKDTALRHFFETYFGYGDMIYAMICGVVVRSSYFRRTIEEP